MVETTGEKKPRLFYFEEACDAWVPAPDHVENILSLDSFMSDNEEIEIRFKRVDMTDDEYDNMPEG